MKKKSWLLIIVVIVLFIAFIFGGYYSTQERKAGEAEGEAAAKKIQETIGKAREDAKFGYGFDN